MNETAVVSPAPILLADRFGRAALRAWVARVFPDARIPVLLILGGYLALGFTVLGWNRSPMQALATSVSACLLELALMRAFKKKIEFPLSALITSFGLSILLNYSHGYALLIIPVFYAIGAKYVFTFKGRHAFNPAQIGVVLCLLTTQELITSAPAYQWYGVFSMAYFVLFPALMFFMPSIDRTPLVASFLITYTAQTALRAVIMRHHLPFDTLFWGTLSSPSFLLFTFFMITDPATSPKNRREQIWTGVSLATLDLMFHIKQSYYTFFYAAFTLASAKLAWRHLGEARVRGFARYAREAFLESGYWKRPALLASAAAIGFGLYRAVIFPTVEAGDLRWKLEEIPAEKTGIQPTWGGVYERLDPRVQNIAKWLFSVGDAVAVGDYDGDGLQDIFLTLPLESDADRLSLYRNLGDFRFERMKLPAVDLRATQIEEQGVGAGASWVDYDSDGDLDLFIAVAFGPSMLLRNELNEKGSPSFTDVTRESGLERYTNSVVGTWADLDRDGRLDLIVGNVLPTHLPGYPKPTELSLFRLPKPEYAGDRRMFNFMHASWNNANNGGRNEIFLQKEPGRFVLQDSAEWGIPETRWTLAIGAADLDRDGWTDLYVANDFGPDDLYFNDGGKRLRNHKGRLFGAIGKDTYKGMNASIADVDRNGWLDVYVSNVHHDMQAEGSLLWMFGAPDTDGAPPAIRDRATEMGALNERRFGWGAAMTDFDNDGWVDVAQANGMVDDTPEKLSGLLAADRPYEDCPDYWYVNEKIARSPPSIHSYIDAWGDIRGMCIYGREVNRLYLNRGNGSKPQFVDAAKQLGVGEAGTPSRAMAAVDLDNDGRMDLVTTRMFRGPMIHRNAAEPSEAARWVGLTLKGDGRRCNAEGIGSRVELTFTGADGKRVKLTDEMQVMTGFGAQGDRRLHFGLGDSRGKVQASVLWCGQWREEFADLPVDRYHTLRQSESVSADAR